MEWKTWVNGEVLSASDINAIQTGKADIQKLTAAERVALGGLAVGEFCLETDTKDVYVGAAGGDQLVSDASALANLVGQDQALKKADSPTFAGLTVSDESGLLSAMPTLAVGKQYLATDTRELYIGSSVGNIRVHGDCVTPEQYGAVGDDAHDDTAAIRSAIANLQTIGYGTLCFDSKKTYLVTDELLVSHSGIHLNSIGGMSAARIHFVPAAPASCIKFSNGATNLQHNSIKNITVLGDNAVAKVAFEISDCTNFAMEACACGTIGVGGNLFTGGAYSTGVLLKGRDLIQMNRCFLWADLPIHIGRNPNRADIALDSFKGTDNYLLGDTAVTATEPLILIDNNAAMGLLNVEFNGGAWVGGLGGVYWNDDTSTATSISFSIRNLRYEQCAVNTGYFVNINKHAGAAILDGIVIDNVCVSPGANGIFLRSSARVSLRDYYYTDVAPAVALDIGSATVTEVRMENVYSNSTVFTLAGALNISGMWNIAGIPTEAVIRTSTAAAVERGFFSVRDAAQHAKRLIVGIDDADGPSGTAYIQALISGVDILPLKIQPLTGGTAIGGTFGCNGATPQAAKASGGALNAYAAGANGLSAGADMAALHALVVAMRDALVSNGIMS